MDSGLELSLKVERPTPLPLIKTACRWSQRGLLRHATTFRMDRPCGSISLIVCRLAGRTHEPAQAEPCCSSPASSRDDEVMPTPVEAGATLLAERKTLTPRLN